MTSKIRSPFNALMAAVLLLAAGSALYSQVAHPLANGPSVGSQFQQLLLNSLPQAFALGGFVAVIMWLVLGALDRLPADQRPDGHDTEGR